MTGSSQSGITTSSRRTVGSRRVVSSLRYLCVPFQTQTGDASAAAVVDVDDGCIPHIALAPQVSSGSILSSILSFSELGSRRRGTFGQAVTATKGGLRGMD